MSINAPALSDSLIVAPENRIYYPALDGLRAVALMLVFLDHYAGIEILGLGVNTFFTLSGFLITGILLDSKTRPDRYRSFYIRRILRIFPLFYGIFAVLFLLTEPLHIHWNSAWLAWLLYLGNLLPFVRPWLPLNIWYPADWGGLFVGGTHLLRLGHFWSLCIEEQFYLVWPFIVCHADGLFFSAAPQSWGCPLCESSWRMFFQSTWFATISYSECCPLGLMLFY